MAIWYVVPRKIWQQPDSLESNKMNLRNKPFSMNVFQKHGINFIPDTKETVS
jgi:hypothetical protein